MTTTEYDEKYRECLVEVINLIRSKASYLKLEDPSSAHFNQKVFEGMAQAYHWVLDGIVEHIKARGDISLAEVGLDDYDQSEIMNYRPLRSQPSE